MRHSDPSFEKRAKDNSEKLMQTHEFRKENITEMELGEKDYFVYTPDEPQRYSALNFEHMFRFETTFSSIKWGIFVGSLFALHRYYRTRSLNNAAHWFTIMSFFSFFNIWVSNGLQHFITDYTMRKSVALSQRNEFQTNAYKSYYEDMESSVDYIDKELTVQPIMKNSQAESLNEFIENYQKYLIAKFSVGRNILNIDRMNDDAKLVVKNDVYNIPVSRRDAEKKLKDVIARTECIDLKSYDFNSDPDNVYM